MLIKCPECDHEVSDSAPACPHCGFALAKAEPRLAPAPHPPERMRPEKGRPPLFVLLSGAALFACFFSPRFLVFLPVMITIGLAVIALTRREAGRVVAGIVIVLAIGLLFLSSTDSTTSALNLDAAEVVDWNWEKDAGFGTKGAVKWNVVVRNKSDRPISMVKVEFTTYDSSGRLLDSTFTYVTAIPAGESRSADSYADYYGSESRADVKLGSVSFSEN